MKLALRTRKQYYISIAAAMEIHKPHYGCTIQSKAVNTQHIMHAVCSSYGGKLYNCRYNKYQKSVFKSTVEETKEERTQTYLLKYN